MTITMYIKEALQNKEGFSNVECLIAEYILHNKEKIKNESSRHIADALFISAPSIVRLCQKLGYKGYNDFKSAYLSELEYFSSHFKDINPNLPFAKGDDELVISNKLGKLYQETIDDTLSIMDREVLKKALAILLAAKNIIICSAGIPKDLAEIFKFRLSGINKNVITNHHITDLYYKASYAGPEDCFIFISYSGETEQIVHVAEKVKQRRVPAIAITSLGKSRLNEMIDCALYISTREKLYENIGSFCSNVSVLFLLDILYANIFTKNYEMNLVNKKQLSIEFERHKKTTNSMLKDD